MDIDSEYAIPMQDMVDKNDYDISSLEKNILDYYTIGGKLYSMPFNSSTPILFYNKTVSLLLFSPSKAFFSFY